MRAMVLNTICSLCENKHPLQPVEIPIFPEVEEFELEDANQALIELKERKIRGAKVLRIG